MNPHVSLRVMVSNAARITAAAFAACAMKALNAGQALVHSLPAQPNVKVKNAVRMAAEAHVAPVAQAMSAKMVCASKENVFPNVTVNNAGVTDAAVRAVPVAQIKPAITVYVVQRTVAWMLSSHWNPITAAAHPENHRISTSCSG